jgi:type I restriction enzyme M protein
MNMLMHGVDYQNFDIYKGDTLTNDLYGEALKLTVQVCNPPYSLKWDSNPQMLDNPRYSGVSKLAPKSHADFAFVQHMVYHMDEEDGRVAVLLPHGVLFRGGAEEEIRKWLINTVNRLDAVIGLPANLFHGTSIPVCILVLKVKRNGNADNIFFIDASKDFIKGKNQNELSDEHIKRIIDTYVKRENVDKYAYKATMDEIRANDYNLNIPRYVDISEEEKEIDLSAVSQTIKDIDREIGSVSEELKGQFEELGLEFPF